MADVSGSVSTLVQAPTEAVYDYLRDFTRHPEWCRNLSRVTQVSAGPVGVGTVFRASEGPPPTGLGRQAIMLLFVLIGLTQGVRTYSEAEITALEPGRRIAWRARLPRRRGDFNRAEWEIILEPRGQATEVTQRYRYSPQTWAARGMVGSGLGIQEGTAVNLAGLKAALEGRAAGPVGR